MSLDRTRAGRGARVFSTVFAAALALAFAACNGDEVVAPSPTPTATTEAAVTPSPVPGGATPTATPSATPAPTETPPPTSTPVGDASFAWLGGLLCQGTWTNETAGRSGGVAVRFEVGGQGGLVTVEAGGQPFGGAGGTTQLPFSIEDGELVIDAEGDFLGRVIARLTAGEGEVTEAKGTLEQPPALDDGGRATLLSLLLTPEVLEATVEIELGDGQTQRSVVEAECR